MSDELHTTPEALQDLSTRVTTLEVAIWGTDGQNGMRSEVRATNAAVRRLSDKLDDRTDRLGEKVDQKLDHSEELIGALRDRTLILEEGQHGLRDSIDNLRQHLSRWAFAIAAGGFGIIAAIIETRPHL